jgi:predicted PurR-regulated permease PerM
MTPTPVPADNDRLRAGLLLLVLGAAIVVALLPFATGLIAIPVLYVIFQPVHQQMPGRKRHPRLAAGLITSLALLLLVLPAGIFGAMVLAQAREVAQDVAQDARTGRLETLRIAGFTVGPAIVSAGNSAVAWLGGSAISLIGTATRQALNLVIALFGLYHLLLRPTEVWRAVSTYLPFSGRTTEKLRARFRNVTTATVIGTGLVAVIQAVLIGTAFWLADIPNALFWSMVTVVLSILPVVGCGLVWAPAAVWLAINGRYPAAVALALLGLLVISNVEFFIRPTVSKRWAHIHPVITLVGALAGVRYFGLLGLLIGPLALSYFFELMAAYRMEYSAEPAE